MTGPLRPTLLIFTLGEARETRRRRLLPPALAHLERQLYRRCLEEALEAGRANHCRALVAAPQGARLPESVPTLTQTTGRFSERLEACLGEVSATSEGPVIVLGTDTPGLSAHHVARTLAALAADPETVVVGPSPDGGLYLLAASEPLPDLSRVAWCTGNARTSLVQTLRAAGREVLLLDELADLDTSGDLVQWLAGLQDLPRRWLSFALTLVRVLIGHRGELPAFDGLSPSRLVASTAGPRAPPA